MKLGISLLSSMKSLIGFEIRRGMDPLATEKTLQFQRTVIISLGLLFFYIDFTFDIGRPMDMKEIMQSEEFDHFEHLEQEDTKNH